MLANPVRGHIAPRGTTVPAGDFVVTATFAEHVASGRGPGVDIGDKRCGDPVFAEHDGTVTLAGLLGAAKVVRIMDPTGVWESGYAHLASYSVAKGQKVIRGQQIGILGATGADACHLHIGLKKNGVEVDSWPLFDEVIQEAARLKAATAPLVTKIANAKKALA